MGDFAVHTDTRCFLCADRILQPLKQELDPSGSDACPLHSLQYLSQYLKIEMNKIFIEGESVPIQLLATVKTAKLKVELCEECIHLNEMFSKLYQKLSKIEMEVGSCLYRIHSKLARAESVNAECTNVLDFGDPRDLLEGKLQIASLLRSEIMQKCLPVVTNALPRVKVQSLTELQVIKRSHRRIKPPSQIKRASSSDEISSTPVVESLQLKVEQPDQDPLHDDDDMGTGHLESKHGPQREDHESTFQHNPTASTMNFGNRTPSLARPPKHLYVQKLKLKCDNYPNSTIQNRYNCNICYAKFTQVGSLNRHLHSLHAGLSFKCEKCDKIFTRKDNLSTHFQNVHIRHKLECPLCSKWLSSKVSLGRHLRLDRCKAKMD